MSPSDSVTLRDALGQYVNGLKSKESAIKAKQGLLLFVNWCGPERNFTDLKPPEIGSYGDEIGSNGPQAMEKLQEVKKFLAYAKKTGIVERDLASHIRIRKASGSNSRKQIHTDNAPLELTAEGHKSLTEEVENLKGDRAPLARMIRQAAADKDVRENVPLEAAREQLGHVESRIAQIERTLKAAVVVELSKIARGKSVVLGSRVVLQDSSSGREMKYTVVSSAEANPLKGKISDVSPVGMALLKRSAGDKINVLTPRGELQYSIVKVMS